MALVVLLGLPIRICAQDRTEVIAPTETVNLLADSHFKDFVRHFNPKSAVTLDRQQVWSIQENGHLRVSGQAIGYLRTKAKYRDYHLVLEYRWGEHTWHPRADAARDCGLLVHAYGEDGAYGGSWMNSIESQLIEGGSGDILVLAAKDSDGTVAPTRLLAEVREDRDGEPVWTPGGQKREFPTENTARINWEHRDPDWSDVKGYQGARDIELPVGEWNRMEVICRGDAIRVVLNGQTVNEGTRARPDEGYICLQSEGAEVFVRRYELWPLGAFQEAWAPPKPSTDTGYSETGAAILPRRRPWSPSKSQAAWQVDGAYELQLVAAEPLVCDPVDVVWDERGRMLVAELRDYPLPPEPGPLLSRIRLLKDVDGDGRMDAATTWADELPDVQGLLPFAGGLLITCRRGVMVLKDTNDDGVADEFRDVMQINAPRHSQLQIASPRWRLDNLIHLNNGIDGREIRLSVRPDQVLPFKGHNLTFDPRATDLQMESGIGQFGASIDDFGRVYFCSNRNPAMLEVLPRSVLDRNRFAGFSTTHEDIQSPAARVFPYELSHTTSIAHAGTHTAACGLAIYSGNWMADLRGNLLVCDPTAQLVTRNRLEENGSSLKAVRLGDRRDFLVSADEWCRPVNLRNGPDGALYLCDMYRRFIDHSIYFPEDFAHSNYMRAGFDHGRIWRLAPKGARPRTMRPLPHSSAELVRELDSKIRWRRIHAQRLLVARGDAGVTASLKRLLTGSDSHLARLHALWTLQGIHDRFGRGLSPSDVVTATLDENPRVVENAVVLAARRDDVDMSGHASRLLKHRDARVRMLTAALHGQHAPIGDLAKLIVSDGNDPWVRRAILSTSPATASKVLKELLQRPEEAPNRATLVEFTRAVAAQGKADELAQVLRFVAADPSWQEAAVLLGLVKGLPQGPFKSLSSLLQAPPDQLAAHLDGVRSALRAAQQTATDSTRSTRDRLDAIALIQDDLLLVADELIRLDQPPEIQAAVCRALAGENREKAADFFFARWRTLGPTARREALALITGNSHTAIRLMQKMQTGEIAKSLMPAMSRWTFSRSSDPEIKSLALELFGPVQSDRSRVVAQYEAALQDGDAERGRHVFVTATCVNCHQKQAGGVQVGPDIRDVRIKPPAAILTDILDPNRAVEERWMAYNVQTNSGQTLTGLIVGETAAAIELALANGQRQTIARNQIESLSATGMSMMPDGLEKQITEQQMSDLIAFLKSPLNTASVTVD